VQKLELDDTCRKLQDSGDKDIPVGHQTTWLQVIMHTVSCVPCSEYCIF